MHYGYMHAPPVDDQGRKCSTVVAHTHRALSIVFDDVLKKDAVHPSMSSKS